MNNLENERKVVFYVRLGYTELNEESMENFKGEVRRIITERLPNDLKYFDLPVRIDLIDMRKGSLTVIFAAIFTGYTLISSYKGFIDSASLIKKHCNMLLNELMFKRNIDEVIVEYYPEQINLFPEFQNENEMNIRVINPDKEHSDGSDKIKIPTVNPFTNTNSPNKCLYYLLVLFFIWASISTIFIIWLVYGAVVKTYMI